jgi:hypothetical protein
MIVYFLERSVREVVRDDGHIHCNSLSGAEQHRCEVHCVRQQYRTGFCLEIDREYICKCYP